MTTGTKRRLLREEKGWGQEVLAEKLDMTQSGISRLEADKITLSWENATKLGELFEVDPEYFFRMEVNSFNNHAYSVNQVNGTYKYTDLDTIKALYEEKLQAKDELLQERFVRNTELKEQNADLKKENVELKRQLEELRANRTV